MTARDALMPGWIICSSQWTVRERGKSGCRWNIWRQFKVYERGDVERIAFKYRPPLSKFGIRHQD